jgi:uridine kinase
MSDIQIYNDKDLRRYINTLVLVYLEACNRVFPNKQVVIEHSINKGFYTELVLNRELVEEDVEKIKKEMNRIIADNMEIGKELLKKDVAIEIFRKQNMMDKVLLFENLGIENIKVCKINNRYYNIIGETYKSTGKLENYDLKISAPGLVLIFPRKEHNYSIPEYNHQEKLFNIFIESEIWAKLLKVSNSGELNKSILNGEINDIIRVTEALHEKKIAYIADSICESDARVILIAGPSSSGKTTFANRLGIQLKVNGKDYLTVSLDDYFVERKNTPKDSNGDYNFDTIEALDIDLFNKDLTNLLSGKEIIMPRFNFFTGMRESQEIPVSVDAGQYIVIEGIHALNEKLTASIEKKLKYSIYISALTQLNIDDHNRVSTTDLRLIRRLIRDMKYRGHNGERTLELWDNVVKGENNYIFPYQENADVMFNSSLIYELTVLKKYAIPIIEEIRDDCNYCYEKKRLLEFLSYFMEIEDDSIIPNTSIIKEFIGGSCFR